MKYHLFIDETGDPSLKSINEDFPIFVLVGCLFSDAAYTDTCTRLAELKESIFESANVILHSRDIRKCNGVFAKLFDLELKERFYLQLNKILGEADFTVIAVAIRKQSFVDRYGKIADDPYELSLSFLLERAIMETDTRKATSLKVTAESRGKKEDGVLSKRYNRLLDLGSGHISSQRFRNRITEFRFRKKEENDCGLQVADLCAYPIARHILFPALHNPAFEIVSRKIRKSAGGKLEGYGIKVFPE